MKDRRSKIIDFSLYICLLFLFLFGLFYSYFHSFNEHSFYVTIALFSVASFTNLGFIILRLILVDGYDFKKYTPYLHASYLFISILMYYLLKNLAHFTEYYYLYWLGLILGNLIVIITFLWLNKNAKEEKPRFIQNRR